MVAPHAKMWKKTVRWRLLSGLLIGIGIAILLVATHLVNESTGIGFAVGMGFSLAGIVGLLTA